MKRLCLLMTLIASLLAVKANELHDMRVAILGDSMSWIGGDSCQNPQGWTYFFKREFAPGAIDIYARSGATWTNTPNTSSAPDEYSDILADNNVIFNQVLRLLGTVEENPELTPDVVLVYAGTNDAWFKDRRPGLYDFNAEDYARQIASAPLNPACFTSLKGSVLLSYSLLHQALPDAKIIFVTPVEAANIPLEDTRHVSEILSATGSAIGAGIIRADLGVDIRQKQEKRNFKYTSDGVHTNSRGAKLLATFIGTSLTDILKKDTIQ